MDRRDIISCLVLVLFIVLIVWPHSSNSPDGLQRVALEKDFAHKATAPLVPVSRLKAVLCVLFVFGAGYGIGFLLRRKKRPNE